MSGLDPIAAAALVRRIEGGEAEAEAQLVGRCGAVLRFLARRHARTESDAEDLYQETVIVALEKIRRGEVREPERLAGFLRALVRNLAIGHYRRRHHDAERPADDDVLVQAADDRTPGPLGDLMHHERNAMTRKLLGELEKPRDRAVLVRYYFGEEGSERICTDLGIAPDHLYRVLHRARRRFRKLWEARAES